MGGWGGSYGHERERGRTGHSRWQRRQACVGALCGESSLDARATWLFTITLDALVGALRPGEKQGGGKRSGGVGLTSMQLWETRRYGGSCPPLCNGLGGGVSRGSGVWQARRRVTDGLEGGSGGGTKSSSDLYLQRSVHARFTHEVHGLWGARG
jgi:hypothetical protein